jgi:hypothetical protein
MNLSVEMFHGRSLQGFRYDQKSFSYIKSATPKIQKSIYWEGESKYQFDE